VFVDIHTVGDDVAANDIFGTIEAVKTVSDLFMPIDSNVLAVNEAIDASPELVNTDPYGEGWIIRVKLADASAIDGLMSADEYKAEVNA
jgi:glycine cleavage system H protein